MYSLFLSCEVLWEHLPTDFAICLTLTLDPPPPPSYIWAIETQNVYELCIVYPLLAKKHGTPYAKTLS